MELTDFKFTSLKEDARIKPFKCKNKDLNGFLFEDAHQYLHELMAITYILEDPIADKTVAYFSLLNDKISSDPELKSIWNRLSRKVPNSKRRRHYPAVKIGRLAVSKEYANKGLGCAIIRFIKHLFTHGNRTGCRFITVDAYRDALGFYERVGFDYISTKDENDETRLMYYDLKRFMMEEG